MSVPAGCFREDLDSWETSQRYTEMVEPWLEAGILQFEAQSQICFWNRVQAWSYKTREVSAILIVSQVRQLNKWSSWQPWWFLRKLERRPIQSWLVTRKHCSPQPLSGWENQLNQQPPQWNNFHEAECLKCKNML